MSGVGKSTVLRRLEELGHRAVDLDGPQWCVPQPDGRQLWREDTVTTLLDGHDEGCLVVAGCEENMSAFLPRFDLVVLLTAPTDVLLSRLQNRTGNPYGKSDEDRRRVLDDIREIVPRLQRIAHAEVGTDAPLDDVVTEVRRLIDR